MSQFLTDLDIKDCPQDEGLWELCSPLIYKSDLLTDPTSSSSTSGLITVPTGFFTDLASVPRIPIIFEAWGNRAHMEAVIHDYLYRVDSSPFATFMQANEVFREAMKVRGKPWYIRHFMFAGVCLGWPEYHQKRVDWKPGSETPATI